MLIDDGSTGNEKQDSACSCVLCLNGSKDGRGEMCFVPLPLMCSRDEELSCGSDSRKGRRQEGEGWMDMHETPRSQIGPR
ncbi:hypothetical protein HN51_032394, partial [Arachis hypogaea]